MRKSTYPKARTNTTILWTRFTFPQTALNVRLGEREDYENQINYYKMKWNWQNNMTVTPVAFNVDHEEKLGHNTGGFFLATNPEFHKLSSN